MTITSIIFWGGLGSMLLISLLIGIIKKAENSIAWMSAKKESGMLRITGSIIGTMVGGALFVAIVVMGYENGIVGIYIGLAYAFGLFTLGLFSEKIVNLLEESQSETLFHFVVKKLNKKVGRLYAIISAVLFTFAVAGQILAMSHYFTGAPGLEQKELALFAAFLVSAAIVFIYVFTGGLRKDIISDNIQLVYMAIGLGLIIPYIIRLPSKDILSNLDKKLYTVGAYGPIFLIGALLMITPMLLVRVDLWQRIRAAKSPKIAKWSFFLSAPIVSICYCFFTYIGMLARGLGVESGTNLLVGVLTQKQIGTIQSWIISALSVAFIGAVISSLDSLLNITSISYVRTMNTGEEEAESETPLRNLRIASFVVVAFVIIILVFFSNVVDIFVGAVSFIMVLAPPILHTLSGKQPSEKGAFYSLIFGSGILAIMWFIIPKNAFVPAVIVGWSIYFSFVLAERRRQN